MPETKSPRKTSSQPGKFAVGIQSLARVINTLIETFGWPGTLLVLGFWFVVSYATAEQKQRIVEIYVLGTGISRLWPLLFLTVVFVTTLLAQRSYYVSKLKILSDEVEREGRLKSALQAELTQRQLQHAESRTERKRK
jgi:hypothetical protein